MSAALRESQRVCRRRFALVVCGAMVATIGRSSAAQDTRPASAPPPPPTAGMRAAIGEYAVLGDTVVVLERNGRLLAVRRGSELRLTAARDVERDAGGRGAWVRFGAVRYPRIAVGTEEGVAFRVVPRKPVDELRRDALQASPPAAAGTPRKADLIEISSLDPGIRLDIRYATTNNFLGAPMYSSARAFLQRPAALALARAHRTLTRAGFGLLVHDAYRPWYVTRMFWDATAGADHAFVADPGIGSRHNRGAAVDLTMYVLATGQPVRMPSGYDEFTSRAFADYPGGSTVERWHRAILRAAMERERFVVNPTEWWHFDFEGWREFAVLNLDFEQLRPTRRP